MSQETTDTCGLRPEDLVPMGTFFMNDFRLRCQDSPESFRVCAPETPVGGLAIMTAIIAAFFVAYWFMIETIATPKEKRIFQIAVVPIGAIAISGPLFAHLWRLRHLRSLSPLLEFDKRTG